MDKIAEPCKNCKRSGYALVYLPGHLFQYRCRCGYETWPWAIKAQALEEWNERREDGSN